MEKDLKTDLELMKKLSDAQTLISIEGKTFTLNEMSIGRARKFGVEIIKAVDEISKLSNKDITEMEMVDMLQDYGDIIFTRITAIINWLFSYKNPDYVEVSVEWIEDNIPLRILSELVKEVARQNQLSWLVPFFQERFQKALKTMES